MGLESQTTELRRLLESVAAANSSYWTDADVSEAFEMGLKDMEAALQTWRAIAAGYGLVDLHGKH